MQTISWNQNKVTPSKIVCVGRNYAAHIEELNNPKPDEIVLFLKPNSSVSNHLQYPKEECRYETEISFLIEEKQIVGVGIGLDLTLIQVQQRLKKNRLPWEKAKAFDHSAVFTPFVTRPESLSRLWLRMLYNDEIRQEGGTFLMLHSPQELLTEAQKHFSLQDGDILMTGTPKGVGILEPNAKIEVQLWDAHRQIIAHTWHCQETSF